MTTSQISAYEILTDHNKTDPLQSGDTGIHKFIDVSKFNSQYKLLRVTSYTIRFIHAIKQKSVSDTNYITVNELKNAELLWIQSIQSESFTQEHNMLKNKKSTKSSLVNQLKLFHDASLVIRCGGRFQNADLQYNSKFPILLPTSHYFTELIVKNSHVLVKHAGVEIIYL